MGLIARFFLLVAFQIMFPLYMDSISPAVQVKLSCLMQFSWKKIFSDNFCFPSILDLKIIKTHVLDFPQNDCAIFHSSMTLKILKTLKHYSVQVLKKNIFNQFIFFLFPIQTNSKWKMLLKNTVNFSFPESVSSTPHSKAQLHSDYVHSWSLCSKITDRNRLISFTVYFSMCCR